MLFANINAVQCRRHLSCQPFGSSTRQIASSASAFPAFPSFGEDGNKYVGCICPVRTRHYSRASVLVRA